jgi:hypothetical protein
VAARRSPDDDADLLTGASGPLFRDVWDAKRTYASLVAVFRPMSDHWCARVAWAGWSGDLPLVARIARSAQFELERRGGVQSFEIAVSVGRDVERFASPAAFVSDVTPDARRRFQTLEISVGNVSLDQRSRLLIEHPKGASAKPTEPGPLRCG